MLFLMEKNNSDERIDYNFQAVREGGKEAERREWQGVTWKKSPIVHAFPEATFL